MSTTMFRAAIGFVLASLPAGLAGADTLVASTAYRGFLPGHAAAVTLADVASSGTGATGVHVVLLDSHDRVLAEAKGPVRRGRPLTLRVSRASLPNPKLRLPVRAVVRFRVTGEPSEDLSRPMLSFETWNPSASNSLAIESCQLTCVDQDVPNRPIGNCNPCSVELYPEP